MEYKTSGIVLRIIKYNDRSNIITLYSRDLGRCAILVNIPKSSKLRIKSILFQPLAILDLNLVKAKQNGFYKVRDVKPLHVYKSIPYHPLKAPIAIFLAEFIYHAVKEEIANQNLFDYLQYSIVWLDESERFFSNFHLVFLMRFPLFLGFYPNLENYQNGDYFDLNRAEFVSRKPLDHIQFINQEEASHIVGLMRMSYNTMHLFKLQRSQRNRILDILNDFYKIHVPNFPQLKSLSILRELFD